MYDSSLFEISDEVNEIRLTSMELQSDPKFWCLIAASQTTGLCQPYADLIQENQALKCP